MCTAAQAASLGLWGSHPNSSSALVAAGGGRGGGVRLLLLVKLDRDRLEQHPLAVGAVVVRGRAPVAPRLAVRLVGCDVLSCLVRRLLTISICPCTTLKFTLNFNLKLDSPPRSRPRGTLNAC